MPLDNLQREILRILLQTRGPQNHFAGGSVLHRHGPRLSNDRGIFVSPDLDLVSVAAVDIALLEKAGYVVTRSRMFEGFVEVRAGTQEAGFTRIQWVTASQWNFFAAVPDADYGYRLHYADLAINKTLAAGARREPRDFVDLAFIHEHLLPLWVALWAAPSKDPAWSPLSLLERISMNKTFRQEEIDFDVLAVSPISASEVGRTIGEAIDEARATFSRLPPETAGCLFVNSAGIPVANVDEIVGNATRVHRIDAKRGGAWPSSPEIDHSLVEAVQRAFGPEGQLPEGGPNGPP
jgi:hypothetical protein